MKPVLLTLLVAVLLAIAVGALLVYSGAANVAALSPRGGALDWVLSTAMEHSVRARAADVKIPELGDSSLISLGFDHYREMCVTCHGSPAGGMSEAGMGLNPNAPELSEAANDWTAAELYWIVKNGVKMTGMPAFGPTHSERELWAIVAFLQDLKSMTPVHYRALISKNKETEAHEGTQSPRSNRTDRMKD
jgi:mono/diheme cytochrome c family protein